MHPPALVTGLIILVAVVVAGLLLITARRRALHRAGGTFDCSLRRLPRAPGKGWRLGVARYADDTVEWFRVFSLSPRSKLTVARTNLVVRGRRVPTGTEALTLLSGAVVIECAAAGAVFELGMSQAALTGFLSWLEASPPGRNTNVA